MVPTPSISATSPCARAQIKGHIGSTFDSLSFSRSSFLSFLPLFFHSLPSLPPAQVHVCPRAKKRIIKRFLNYLPFNFPSLPFHFQFPSLSLSFSFLFFLSLLPSREARSDVGVQIFDGCATVSPRFENSVFSRNLLLLLIFSPFIYC